MRQLAASPADPSRNDVMLDVVGFLLGLGMAWAFGWHATDLVWSLWLSSLVIGYASLLIGIATVQGQAGAPRVGVVGAKVFLVGFFSVHFGLFHFVHSLFLHGFFPLHGDSGGRFLGGFGPGLDGYVEVFTRYWPWLLAAAIAERANLRPLPQQPDLAPAAGRRPETTAETSAAVPAPAPSAQFMVRPYVNVVRMHLLIFFFAGASMVGLDGFPVYLVVYAVYFLPWRLWLRSRHGASQAADRL